MPDEKFTRCKQLACAKAFAANPDPPVADRHQGKVKSKKAKGKSGDVLKFSVSQNRQCCTEPCRGL